MYKLIVLAAFVCTANAGLISGGSFASSPALGAPLLGSVSYNAPEVSVVKQPITIDQPEIRYRAVPTLVQAPALPVAQTIVAAPAVSYAAAPAVSYAAAPAVSYAAAPAVSYAAAPAISYAAAPAAYGYQVAAPAFAYGATPAATYNAGLGYAYNTAGIGYAGVGGFGYVV